MGYSLSSTKHPQHSLSSGYFIACYFLDLIFLYQKILVVRYSVGSMSSLYHSTTPQNAPKHYCDHLLPELIRQIFRS